jgi:hypothetical protein
LQELININSIYLKEKKKKKKRKGHRGGQGNAWLARSIHRGAVGASTWLARSGDGGLGPSNGPAAYGSLWAWPAGRRTLVSVPGTHAHLIDVIDQWRR